MQENANALLVSSRPVSKSGALYAGRSSRRPSLVSALDGVNDFLFKKSA